ncbi:hypothetical protein [Rhizobium fabae]|jgi:uncharacterized membrane protein YciS (DUF1049 family)|uniref:Uncharacterized membrane protein YciS (DUF1049 family) n=1 Tax=Rhizobium fabae TaxID=573179 RepID=A0A7W6BDT8_9HYPH|nr:hypothetical protein [Rhizobium fabae]MBB3919781.1 uncharacterized membrane protein YciS (DUF1049 family) [Rhizobium fabae]RUM05675.1 hypothetical protein EFB14_32705 [Rhizobium fabae]
MKHIVVVVIRSFLISLTIIGGQKMWEVLFNTREFEFSLRAFLILFGVGLALSLSVEMFEKRLR